MAQPPQLPQSQSQQQQQHHQQQQSHMSSWRSGSLGSRGKSSFACSQGATPVPSFQPVAGPSPVQSQKHHNLPTPQASEAAFSNTREEPTSSSGTRRVPIRNEIERAPRATSLEEPRRQMAQLHLGGSRSPCPGRHSPCPPSRGILAHKANGTERSLAGSVGTVGSLAGSISTVPPGASVGSFSPSCDARRRLAMLHEIDAQTLAVQGACKQTAALLKNTQKPAIADPLKENSKAHLGLDLAAALLSAAQALHEDAADSMGQTAPASASTGTALAALQAHIEEQQRYQTGLLESLSQQWELRFATIEKALLNGLEGASAASALMNERSGRFVLLAEGLEHAISKSVGTTEEVSVLAQDVKRVEKDLACLAEELASEKAERQRTLAAVGQQTEHQVACLCANIKDSLLCHVRDTNTAVDGDGCSKIDRLDREVRQERAERSQLATECRTTANETEQLRKLLASANEYLFNLSHELVVGYGGNGNQSQSAGLKLEYAQRLESLGKELRGELAGRSCGATPALVDDDQNKREDSTTGPCPSKLPSAHSFVHSGDFSLVSPSSSQAIRRMTEDGELNERDRASLEGPVARDAPTQHLEGLTQSIVAMLQPEKSS